MKSDRNQKKIISNYCKRRNEGPQYDCWQYDHMIKKEFSIEEMYKVCRKCMYFKPQKGGIVSKEILNKLTKLLINHK